ncbi:MAG: FGGY-family carbohydrate kinase [Bacillota bacterium]
METKIFDLLESGEAILGLELGSTRIKAVLIDEDFNQIASGSFDWENKFENNYWTYSVDDVWTGVQECYFQLTQNVKKEFDVEISKLKAIGISGMMHGYLPFNSSGKLLTPFRTWRNNTTSEASEDLTKAFDFSIPQRWCISHLYQAILNNEPHVSEIAYLTTLAGYVHWKLTGEKVVGLCEGSGMFPVSDKKEFDENMLRKFDETLVLNNLGWKLGEILPQLKLAGAKAGNLTLEGSKLLDKTGKLETGIPFCPPEGDAGTGMVATNSIAIQTGNVSAGTSVFAMLVLKNKLSKVYPEIDIVATPDGKPVAMVHSNNCSSDLDAWIALFDEAYKLAGANMSKSELYELLLKNALDADLDCGGLLTYGYVSGEHITHFEEGRPLFVRKQNSSFTLANFIRANLYSALGALRIGLEILFDNEKLEISNVNGHGGYFKTKLVGQKIMAACFDTQVSVMETAGEGGAWGIALLASYMINNDFGDLEEFMDNKVFKNIPTTSIMPEKAEVNGFQQYMKEYRAGLGIERAAIENI